MSPAAGVTDRGGRGASGQTMTVEGAASTQSDIVASNGVLHIIDQVLFQSSGTSSSALDESLKLPINFLF